MEFTELKSKASSLIRLKVNRIQFFLVHHSVKKVRPLSAHSIGLIQLCIKYDTFWIKSTLNPFFVSLVVELNNI